MKKLSMGHPGLVDLQAASQLCSLWYSPHRHMGWRAFVPRKDLAESELVCLRARRRVAAKNELK